MDGYPPFANLVYDVATLSWVRMTQPLVDSLTSNLYLAVDGVEGLLTDIKSQGSTNLDGPPRDAFQRWRVSEATSLFDTSLEYGIDSHEWSTSLSGGGAISHSTTSGEVTLSVSTATSAEAILQSSQYIRYQPGKSQLVLITGKFGPGTDGSVRRIGLFDAKNGIFFEMVGASVMGWTCRTDTSGSAYDDYADSALWNIDKLDGSGVSGKTLDISKTNILVIDFQWLGVGRVRVGFDIDGVVCYCHEFMHAGILSVPYMRTPNLPVRYQIYKTGGSTSGSMTAICSSVMTEGGVQFTNADSIAVAATAGRTVATRRALLSIRPKATLNGVVYRGDISPQFVAVTATGTNIITLIELVYNPTLQTSSGSLTWTSAGAASGIEYSVHGDANAGAFTGGEVVESFLLAGTAQQRSADLRGIFARMPLALDIAGANPRAFSIVATDVAGTATVYATLTSSEVR